MFIHGGVISSYLVVQHVKGECSLLSSSVGTEWAGLIIQFVAHKCSIRLRVQLDWGRYVSRVILVLNDSNNTRTVIASSENAVSAKYGLIRKSVREERRDAIDDCINSDNNATWC